MDDNTNTIGALAFKSLPELKEVHMGKNVTTICDGAFALCKQLSTINLPKGISSIQQGAFERCALDECIIPNRVYAIARSALCGNKRLKMVDLGKVKEIHTFAFRWCENIDTLVIPQETVSISMYAFLKACINELILHNCKDYNQVVQ